MKEQKHIRILSSWRKILSFLLFLSCSFLYGEGIENSTPISKPDNATGKSGNSSAMTPISKYPPTYSETFHWCRVMFNKKDCWDAHPYGDELLLKTLKGRTKMEVDETWHVANLEDIDELSKYPFLFMTSQLGFQASDKELANIKEYLTRGGFIYAEDCIANDSRGDYFFAAFKEKIEKLFGQKMVQLPNNHEIYHCFYDMPDGLPLVQGVRPGGWALLLDGRMAIFLSASDLHCGWCKWFTADKTEISLKMGINIIIYAMTH